MPLVCLKFSSSYNVHLLPLYDGEGTSSHDIRQSTISEDSPKGEHRTEFESEAMSGGKSRVELISIHILWN